MLQINYQIGLGKLLIIILVKLYRNIHKTLKKIGVLMLTHDIKAVIKNLRT